MDSMLNTNDWEMGSSLKSGFSGFGLQRFEGELLAKSLMFCTRIGIKPREQPRKSGILYMRQHLYSGNLTSTPTT